MSCSRELLEAVAALAVSEQSLVHTHASENRDEVEVVRRMSGGLSNLEYLADTGLATPHLCAAHCVWVTDAEQALLAERDVKVLHCPGSNLKLGSGIAPVAEMRARGISVSLGADGAACNNRLDMFDEMRLAATLQAVRKAPGALHRARRRLDGDARGRARARAGRRDRIDRARQARRPHRSSTGAIRTWLPSPDPWSTLVYAARGTDVRYGGRDGEVLVHEFALTRMDAVEVAAVGARPRLPSWRGVLVCNSVRVYNV